MSQYTVHSPADLQRACNVAEAGDEILICSGLYDTSAVLRGRRGMPGRPIVLKGADDGWISGGQCPDPYWGGALPSLDAPRKPDVSDFALLLIDKCEHITLDGLMVERCWPSILWVKDSCYLHIHNCRWRDGTYAIFAKGKTSHLLIEDNEWQQDASLDHDLWFKTDWRRAHGNEGSDGLFRFFNGGFLAAKSIEGKVVIRRNRILDAFNGIRMKAEAPGLGQTTSANTDVHIFDNDFVRIRDNPIEPEFFAHNWHVRHNRLLDCHSWFSFDGVTGGYWYFYGNTGDFRSRQGQPGVDEHTMGRVLKLSYEQYPRDPESEGVPTHPWFVFNNSWHLRCPIVGGRNNPLVFPGAEGPDFTARLDFFNNLFEWCNAGRDGPWICEYINLLHNFDYDRSVDVHFDYDMCNRPDFISFCKATGIGEQHGLATAGPLFESSPNGTFQLAPDSAAFGSGWVRDVETPSGALVPLRGQADGSLNRGAVQNYGLMQVPALEEQANTILSGFYGATG